MAENNNELTETEKKDYELDEKEKQLVCDAFVLGIEKTIKEFLDEKYGNSFVSEDDVRARLYYHIVKSFDKPDISA
ncbi:MAG: hypothetical protein WA139_04325 [Candidatus Aenigmatarchaeota archaeon]